MTDPEMLPNRCPACGATLSPGAAHGLCARCLLAGAAEPTESPSGVRPAAPPELAQVGAAFAQLEVQALIGAGGMGAVFRARQPKLNRLVALKVLPASLAERDPAFAERFEREGQMLARLHHPNIVAVYDSGRAGDFFYLLMEHVDGVNLRQAMRASRFTPAQALGIVPRICDALQYAHDEGVLHRDIKPENILLDAKGRVKLADFGIAKLIGDGAPESPHAIRASHPANLTQAGAALGTPSYMAPEQRETPSEVDHRADIYSLGVVFYELLTGELPHGAFARPSAKSDADPRVDAIVQQALQMERDRRQQSAGEVRTQVETVSSHPRVPAPPAPPKPSAAAPSSAKPRVPHRAMRRAALLGAALLLVFGSALFLADRLLPPVYYAKVTMEVMENHSEPEQIFGGDRARGYNRQFVISQINIIHKTEVLYPVIERLDLTKEFAPPGGERLPIQQAFLKLKQSIQLQEVRETQLIEIGVFSTGPQLAANIANTIAFVYQEVRISDSEKRAMRRLANYEEEIQKQVKDLEATALEMEKTRERVGIIDPDPDFHGAVSSSKEGRGTLVEDKQNAANYIDAKTKYVVAGRRLFDEAQVTLMTQRMKLSVPFDAAKIWEKAEPPWKPIPLSLRRLRHAFTR